MDELFIFVIFIIISIINYFSKQKETERDDSSQWPEQLETSKNEFDFESLQGFNPIIQSENEEAIISEHESTLTASENTDAKSVLTSSVLHHDDESIKSTLLSDLKENEGKDAYALKIQTQNGEKSSSKNNPLVNYLTKKDLKRALLFKELLDRPRAFDI